MALIYVDATEHEHHLTLHNIPARVGPGTAAPFVTLKVTFCPF